MDLDMYYDRLSSWRKVVEIAEYSARHWDGPAITDGLLETHLGLLHMQCLQFVQAREHYMTSVKAYVEQEDRPADVQAFVELGAAVSLKAFSQASFHYLQLAMLRSEQAQREEGRRRPASIPPPPPSLIERLFGR